MEINAILVLGDENDKSLRESLFGMGLVPLFRENMQELLSKLRHGTYAAVLVDQEQEKADVLELLLNVRDLNEAIPVIIMEGPRDSVDRKMILTQPQTYVIKKSMSIKSFEKKLKELLKGQASGISEGATKART